MTDVARTAVLIAAAIASGLQAGLYYGFSVGVLPGLARADGRTFVGAMQQINVAIVNPWFMLTFLGAPALAALGVALHLGRSGQSGQSGAVLGFAVAGFVLAMATLVITIALNVPLNDALAAAGDPDRIADLAGVRAAFEDAWLRWNGLRTLTSTAALGCIIWATRSSVA